MQNGTAEYRRDDNRARILSALEGVINERNVRLHLVQNDNSFPPFSFFSNYPRLVLGLEGSRSIRTHHQPEAPLSLKRGEILFLPRKTWWISEWNSSFSVLGINFYRDYTRFWLLSYKAGFPKPKWRIPDSFYHTGCGLQETAKAVIRGLEARENADPDDTVNSLLGTALLRLLRDEIGKDTPPVKSKAQLTWQLLVSHMEENFGNDVTRESLAETFGLHPNYISMLFKRFAKKSFNRYLTTIRIEHAMLFLRSTQLTHKEIAARCGFKSPEYFCRVFKAHNGKPPVKYRLRRNRR